MKVLFICNQNKHRSKTAEELFKHEFETKSAGLYNLRPVNVDQLLWADVIMVMEGAQRAEIARRFPETYFKKRIVSLEIPDVYSYQQSELVKLLKSQVRKAMRQIAPELHL